jgi:predicted lipoprotein with Yx(FWY)xxD motif
LTKKHKQSGGYIHMLYKTGRYIWIVIGMILILAVAACTPAAATSEPEPMPTPVPSVQVSDQDIKGDTVTVAAVVSDGPGWLVIHADNGGNPGAVIGYAALQDGTNTNVQVQIDIPAATETLYAMLHTDGGTAGTYEFPGEDGPVSVNGSVVTTSFQVGNLMSELPPAVEVSNQDIKADTVTISKAVSNGPGWLVIHADSEGSPGPVIGYSALNDGVNENVIVQIDPSTATETLYAMLHTDSGIVGTYEFPGEDGPVSVDGAVVTPAFKVGNNMAEIPMVEVSDQAVMDETVTIDRVVSDGPGWLVVHADADGKPGPVIGYEAVSNGPSENVVVNIDATSLTETLFAMLHTDSGVIGTYEFPGEDGPVSVDGQVITPSFSVTYEMSGAMGESATVMIATDPELGPYLVDSEGMTLYLFTQDEPGVSNCSGPCLASWPPLTVEGEPTAGDGVTGELSTIPLSDGSEMVTYNDVPLYYFAPDKEPGDIFGQGVGGVWYTVSP